MKTLFKFLSISLLLFMTGCAGNINGPFDGFGWKSETPTDADPSSLDFEDLLAEQTTTRSSKLKVGLLLPLTGKGAMIGKSMLNASQLAMMDLGGKNLVLIPADTKSSKTGAVDAANSLIAKDVKLIIGPLYSKNLRAITPITNAKNIPVLALTNDMSQAASNNFIMGFNPDDQVRRVIKYAHDQGKTRFALLTPETAYGRMVKDEAKQAISYLNDDLVVSKTYPPNIRDFTPIVKEMTNYQSRHAAKNAEVKQLAMIDNDEAKAKRNRLEAMGSVGDVGFDAILLAEGKDRVFSIAPLFPYFDVDINKIKLLGTGLWDEPGTHREPALYGAWYAAPAMKERQDFETRYRHSFKTKPPRLASLAYDATALAAVLSRKGGTNPYTYQNLTNNNGFEGVDGIFRLLPTGHVERGLAVLSIQPSGPVIVDQAPNKF